MTSAKLPLDDIMTSADMGIIRSAMEYSAPGSLGPGGESPSREGNIAFSGSYGKGKP